MPIPLWLARVRYQFAVHLWRYWRWYAIIVPLIAFSVIGAMLFMPPSAFPTGSVVTIEEGTPLLIQSKRLESEGVLSSSFLFSLGMRLASLDDDIKSGQYVFDTPLGMVPLAIRLIRGEFGIGAVRVTFTEGMTSRDMAGLLEAAIPGFDTAAFLKLAEPQEGYLFPDTYFIAPDTTPEEVVTLLRSTFDDRVATIADILDAYPASLKEEVIMASLLEKEARTMEVRRTIAGILWNRIEDGMPLQVDAVFGYIYGRPTYSPSLKDLESESPYNTYKYEGLPPGPINNPGLEALRAAATPIESPYVYYLTDAEGNIHYARTFDEHKRNRDRYLK